MDIEEIKRIINDKYDLFIKRMKYVKYFSIFDYKKIYTSTSDFHYVYVLDKSNTGNTLEARIEKRFIINPINDNWVISIKYYDPEDENVIINTNSYVIDCEECVKYIVINAFVRDSKLILPGNRTLDEVAKLGFCENNMMITLKNTYIEWRYNNI